MGRGQREASARRRQALTVEKIRGEAWKEGENSTGGKLIFYGNVSTNPHNFGVLAADNVDSRSPHLMKQHKKTKIAGPESS